ncbi:hypothetical protein ASD67_19860 [Sphingopyxis sp. Root1497]|uniref:hypothetical protein n=1 Tax=Sphingopyxis sp. Root1497 TaxID=1736474 RepID=UPI0006F4FF26|nr:hypothetical protein [Sphingopyxis sp. Root1497]KQZ61473.1 hypothetical protein ASD67_19860 [Sphingopyxis sp. Root1497]
MNEIAPAFSYLMASGLLGAGIAVDVAMATLAMGRWLIDRDNARYWVRAVTATHIVFPMIGYYGFAWAYHDLPAVRAVLGVLALLLVAWFLFGQFRSWINADDAAAADRTISFVAILAVSWDALWSGPAKSAQAIAWSTEAILFSFVIAGAVVGAVAVAATRFAAHLYPSLVDEAARKRQARRDFVALWIEFSVIAYFGVLAFARYVALWPITWPILLAIVAAASLLLFLPFRDRIISVRSLIYERPFDEDPGRRPVGQPGIPL